MSVSGEGRKVRSDKKIRVNPSLPQTTHKKLQRLAIACGLPKTSLAEEIIEIALNNPSFINLLQNHHHADEFRVVPYTENGKVYF